MTNHVNKGAQKLSKSIRARSNSAHEKSAKMEHFHKAHQEKAKSKRTYTKSTHSLCTVRLFEHQIHARYSN